MTRATADLLLLLAALIWGLAFVGQQTAMAHVGPLTFTGTRFLIAAVAVLPFVLREGRRGPAIPRAQAGPLIGIGVVFFLCVGVQQFGLMHTTVTNAGFLTALYVVMVPAIAVVAARRKVHPAVWPAAALSLAGTFLLGGGGLKGLNWGDGLIIVSAFFGALQILGLGLLVGNLGRPLAVAFAQYAVTAAIGISLGLVLETPTLEGLFSAWREIAYTGLVSGGIAFTLQSIAQGHTPPSDAAIIVSMESVFAAAFGALILGERLNLFGWIGAALVMAAVLFVQLVPIYGRLWLRR